MKKLLLILLVGLFLFSCKKKQTIHITAKNAATGEGYAGLTYYVVTYKNSLIPYEGKKSKTVATGSLDENGEAYVTERLSKNNGHSVRVVEPENACYNKNIQFYFSDEKNFKAEFEFAECAYLKFRYQNINCQGPSDHIKVKRYTNLDVHQGDGTAEIFKNTPEVFTFSMHGQNNYPLKKQVSDLDVALTDGIKDDEYLYLLEKNVNEIFQNFTPDFIFFQSGVDILETDKLGKLNLSIAGCKKRDEFVCKLAKEVNVPIVASMGGGYSKEIKHIVEAHSNTYRVAQDVFF